MNPFVQAAVRQIDDALASYDAACKEWLRKSTVIGGEPYLSMPRLEATKLLTLLESTFRRLIPDAGYGRTPQKTIAGVQGDTYPIMTYAGMLAALREDYIAGRLQAIRELIQADLFSDFLEMAEHLLSEGMKDPAAMLTGAVLEEHLRKLCQKHNLPLPAKPKLDTMNADLAKAGIYGKNDQKQITAWAGIRNDAAHGDFAKYDAAKVDLMIQGIRMFLANNPA